jgi:hypothetical protein
VLRVIQALAAMGFVLLFAATIWLAWLNRSEKIYVPLATALVVGTVTGFVSIFSSLQATSTSETLVTSIIVDPKTRTPVLVIPAETANQGSYQRQSDIALRMSAVQEGGTTASMEQLLEALHYDVLRTLSQIGVGSSFGSFLGSAFAGVSQQPPTADLIPYPREALSLLLKGTRFSESPMESFWWSDRSIRVPRGTDVKWTHQPSSPTTGVDRRGLLLVKPNFFRVEIEMKPIGIADGTPYPIHKDFNGPFATFHASVTISSSFEKLTSGSVRSGEYRQWVKWLGEQLRQRLAH